MKLVHSHHKYFKSDVRILGAHRRQILTSNVDPRAVSVNNINNIYFF